MSLEKKNRQQGGLSLGSEWLPSRRRCQAQHAGSNDADGDDGSEQRDLTWAALSDGSGLAGAASRLTSGAGRPTLPLPKRVSTCSVVRPRCCRSLAVSSSSTRRQGATSRVTCGHLSHTERIGTPLSPTQWVDGRVPSCNRSAGGELCELITASHRPVYVSPRNLADLQIEKRTSYAELGMYLLPLYRDGQLLWQPEHTSSGRPKGGCCCRHALSWAVVPAVNLLGAASRLPPSAAALVHAMATCLGQSHTHSRP